MTGAQSGTPVNDPQDAIRDAIDRARAHSPYLRLQADSFPHLVERLAAGSSDAAMAEAHEAGHGDDLAAALRRERNAVSLVLALLDLSGQIELGALTSNLSELADRLIGRALVAALEERGGTGDPESGFAVIALGKLGGRELNFSSDVDLLFLYDPEILARGPREEAGQAALRVARRLIDLLQTRTEEGFAFRVDLRLRPSPEVTPLALAVDSAISYYEASALPWERAAFIRSRFVAGDRKLGDYFLEAIHPFLWRRSLDFGAIGEIQSITRRIRDHYAQGQAFGPGFDIKRGRGGIREIEFFVHAHQLIHGGRDPDLRSPVTLDALEALVAAERLDEVEARDLAAAYVVHRTVEHRLQMVEDRQTHSLPAGDALDNVARLHGLEDGQALLGWVEPHVRRVAGLYDNLGVGEGRRLPLDPEGLDRSLAEAGFVEPAGVRARIDGWRSGRIRSLRTSPARQAFEAMLPALLEAFAAAPDPVAALNRFETLIERLPSGVNFYRLLEARPGLAEHLAAILSHAPTLAEQLGRRPELLDGLIDASAFEPAASVEQLVEAFSRADRSGEDYQALLDRVRRAVNEQRFALGVQLIAGRSDPIDVAEGNSRIAEAAIHVLASATIDEFEKAHGTVEGSELLVLGLGRLGGEALTFASDLDLVYLFTGSHEGRSSGPRVLGATDYFNRLAPRVSASLSVPTAAGPLYPVDTRLRPNGKDGLLAVSLETFDLYQRTQAWTWEHMALVRARPVFGSAQGRARLQDIIDGVLMMERDPERVRADAVRMRAEMTAHRPASGPFDIKMGEGGLVDLEFAIHTLQLQHRIGLRPRLEDALADLAEAGLVPAEADGALRLLIRMLVMFRLVSPSSAEPPEATRPLVARACGLPDWEALLAAHAEARQRISQLWRRVSQGEA